MSPHLYNSHVFIIKIQYTECTKTTKPQQDKSINCEKSKKQTWKVCVQGTGKGVVVRGHEEPWPAAVDNKIHSVGTRDLF